MHECCCFSRSDRSRLCPRLTCPQEDCDFTHASCNMCTCGRLPMPSLSKGDRRPSNAFAWDLFGGNALFTLPLLP